MPKKDNPTPEPQQPEEAERVEVVTAFLSFQLPDGRWRTTNDLAVVTQLAMQRLATPDDFVAGSQVAIKDITALETAMNTVSQFNRLMAQQIQTTKS